MTEIINEKAVDKYPKLVTIDGTKKILNQMENCICKIRNKNGKGTGFFCLIPYQNKKLEVMITNNHIIDKKILEDNKSIEITLNDNKTKSIKLENKKIYTSEKYDTTIIEINSKNEKIDKFLELDEEIFNENNNNFLKESIYILQYPELEYDQKACVSYGVLIDIKDENIMTHFCCTYPGSSGSPILKISNNKIIGIHKGSRNKNDGNAGLFLKNSIIEFGQDINIIKKNRNIEKKEENVKYFNFLKHIKSFFNKNDSKEVNDNQKGIDYSNNDNNNNNNIIIENEIKEKENVGKFITQNEIKKNDIILKLKVGKNDINENIYFFDASQLWNFKLSNKYNTKILINEKNYKYEKYFKPNKEGIYKINIKFNIDINDCTYMLYGCFFLTEIDLSYFDSKNVINMKGMFQNCPNLTKIVLSSFDTSNVTDMSSMFMYCCNLTEIDLSSFNTKNVTNMNCMFENCSNLKSLDLSSFDTRNVKNMKGMFKGCYNLNFIDLSSFETINVTDMNFMFEGCINLKQIKIKNNLFNIISEIKSKNKNVIFVNEYGEYITNISNNYTCKMNKVNLNINYSIW